MNKIRGFEAVSSKYDSFHAEGSSGKLPQRSTKNSAGYDFYAYEDVVIPSNLQNVAVVDDINWIKTAIQHVNTKPYCIKTGIKAYMQEDEVLMLYPRSSWPSKLGLVMANSVGIIDSDYYDNPDNEGEIGFLVYNLTQSPVKIKAGEKLGQGIFTKFYQVDDDFAEGERVGGYGSTGA